MKKNFKNMTDDEKISAIQEMIEKRYCISNPDMLAYISERFHTVESVIKK